MLMRAIPRATRYARPMSILGRLVRSDVQNRSAAPAHSLLRGFQSSPAICADWPDYEILPLAALSPTMEQGGVANWVKQEGDEISAGDVVLELETDKATLDFEAQDDSHLAKILVPAGTSDLPVGTPLAILVEDAADVAAFANATPADFDLSIPAATTTEEPAAEPAAAPAAAAPAAAAAAAAPVGPPAATLTPARAAGERVFASPLARKIARENGFDVGAVSGTGPNGRVVAADVEGFIAAGGSASLSATGGTVLSGEDFAHTATRHAIAERLTQAKRDVPHYYLTVDVDLSEAMRLRNQLATERGVEISINDFVLKASAAAMNKVPDANSAWMDTFIRRFDFVDINVAVNTERGLVMPVVKNVNSTGLLELSKVSLFA